MTDATRWCEICHGWGTHNTDGHEGQKVLLSPREHAELAERSKLHQTNKVKFAYDDRSNAYLDQPIPPWAIEWLEEHRTKVLPVLTVECPRCHAPVATWCRRADGSKPTKNFVHDSRRFKHAGSTTR